MVEPGEVEPVAVAPGRGANPPACIAHRRGDPVLLGIGDGVERQARRPFAKPSEQVFQRRGATLFADIERPDREAVPVGQPRQPIGRASCRARVCQYVYISGVAVYLKKDKQTTTVRK